MVADAGPPLVLMAIGLSTSTSQGDGSPITFYERYGFEQTGDVSDDEVLLRLNLR